MHRAAHRIVVLWLLVVLMALTACVARHIQDAQNHFTRGATTEAELFAKGLAVDGALMVRTTAAHDYRLALALVERELQENGNKLRQEDLYGTAMMLKAMCLWRLADLDDNPDKTIDDKLAATLLALSQAQDVTFGTRDQVMLHALPGLRDHDRGLRATDYETARRFFTSAIAITNKALEETSVASTHPVYVYLRLAQLSTYRAWQHAAYAYLSVSDARQEKDQIHQDAKLILSKLKDLATNDQPMQEQLKILANRLGISQF